MLLLIETPFAKLKISPPCLPNKNMLLVFIRKDSLIFHILFMAIKYLKIMLSVYYFTLFIIKGHYFSHGKKKERFCILSLIILSVCQNSKINHPFLLIHFFGLSFSITKD